jgi:hypothetical protein
MTPTINELVEAARLHFNHLQADITNASTRIEHIRLTALTQEAANLLTNLEKYVESFPDPQLLTNHVTSSYSSAGAAVPQVPCSHCGCLN